MNPASNPGNAPQGWLKNQVNQFTKEELNNKKSPNIIRAAFGHWFDFVKFAITFLAVFIFVQAILIGVEVLFTDISGLKIIAPLEKIAEAPKTEATEEDSLNVEEEAMEDSGAVAAPVAAPEVPTAESDEGFLSDKKIREYFGSSSDEYPEYIDADHFRLVLTINTIIALLASIFVFYYHFFFLLSEDAQTFGLRSGRVELFRKDGRELSSQGGIGGLGKGPALIYSVFYLLFLPVFFILTRIQIEYAFLWSFIEGFRSMDAAIAGTAVTSNILGMFGYWILSIVIVVGVALVIGLIFHVILIVAGLIASAIAKDEPESVLAM